MTLELVQDALPLRVATNDVVLVGQTRVPLDNVVYAFDNGATPEEIVARYPTLQLADVYAVISFYLRHRAAVQAYIQAGEAQSAQLLAQYATPPAMAALRDRLPARHESTPPQPAPSVDRAVPEPAAISQARRAAAVALVALADPLPLRLTVDGVILVAQTRVPLTTVVRAFQEGFTAEEIALHYTALQLPAIYRVISYYLRYQAAVETYLAVREAHSAATRAQYATPVDMAAMRQRLLLRQRAGQA
ncbi:MAG: DUF433 domain-containing protein [Chloroflexota bacterium]|nr:DUF433 domain-containing protein [Chloroflexota bacterium]